METHELVCSPPSADLSPCENEVKHIILLDLGPFHSDPILVCDEHLELMQDAGYKIAEVRPIESINANP